MTRSAIVAIWCLPTSVFRLPVAWVSLDRRDDDPRRFWSCVVAALGRLRADVPPPALAEAAEDSLVEWVDEVIVGIPGDFILALDDYHLIANPTIHRSIAFLLDYAPPTLHLAIATRKDPPLPLAVLRTRDQLAEIRADELSFTLGESAALLQTITGRSLPPEAVEALQGKTEGWAASVQLAGLALRGRPDSFEAARAFSGTHRYIVDYLAEEILTQQDPDRQRFLLETAILDRLCGPLCDAVTGGTGGQATLEAFERGNLLLVPLDEDRRWYRYHHLFASFLRAQLRQTAGQQMPEREPSLHRRAALWLERNGDAAEAFEHWIAAGDTNAAARLAEVTGRDLLNRGELSRITDWLERLAAPATLERPWLGIFQAWVLTVRGEGAAALRRLAQAEARISESSGLDDLELRALRGEASALRAFAESRSGDPVQARRSRKSRSLSCQRRRRQPGASSTSLSGLPVSC